MGKVSLITLTGEKRLKQDAREALALNHYNVVKKAESLLHLIKHMDTISVSQLDRKVKHRQDLTFKEAFVGMCYILAATNHHLLYHFNTFLSRKLTESNALVMGVAFAQLMATKESLTHLTAEEVAGMTAATMMDLMVNLDFKSGVVETCGMGGDRGFVIDNEVRKTINISTLSSFVLCGAGIPTVKHGSYSNTSAVGSTEAIELFGAQTNQESVSQMVELFQETGFCFMDAHWCKTVHDLSHLLMMETINHVIGPMTAPLNYAQHFTKVMGVNEKIYPATIARAYLILHEYGIINLNAAAIVTGLDQDLETLDQFEVKACSVLDELSPICSVVSFAIDGGIHTQLIRPADFGVEIDINKIALKNDKDTIQNANIQALTGSDQELAKYLAMNAALGMYTYHVGMNIDERAPQNLRNSFQACLKVINDGRAWAAMEGYVKATGGKLIPA